MLALWVSGGASASAPCQWRWARPDWGQTCSGSLATLWPQTGVITDGAVFTSQTPSASRTRVLTKIGVAHCGVRTCLCSTKAVYENLCHRLVAIWQLSRWNPIYRGFAFEFFQWVPRTSCCHCASVALLHEVNSREFLAHHWNRTISLVILKWWYLDSIRSTDAQSAGFKTCFYFS